MANGVYTVSVIAGQVNDVQGGAVAAATLGTFTVNQATRNYVGPQGPFDPSTISEIAAGNGTSVDAHHVALSAIASIPPKATPTRAHTNLPKHKHKHKKKKAVASAVVKKVAVATPRHEIVSPRK